MFNAPSTRIRFCLKGIFSPFKKSASTRCVFESFLPVHIQTIMHLVYPQNFLHGHFFQFLLGITVIPREKEDHCYAKS